MRALALKATDALAVWLFVRVIRYWRRRAKSTENPAHMTILFTPAEPELTPQQRRASYN